MYFDFVAKVLNTTHDDANLVGVWQPGDDLDRPGAKQQPTIGFDNGWLFVGLPTGNLDNVFEHRCLPANGAS